MRTQAQLRQKGRMILLSAGLGLLLAAGAVSPAFATGSSTMPQPISKADANPGGANGQCPGGPYCSTRTGAPSLNGNGNGAADGKPCAGCVGKADNKNPPGQLPNGSDPNAGYECDRNHGIGRTNPAHTGCSSVVVSPVVVPPVVVPPVVVPPVRTPVAGSPVVVPPVRTPVAGSPVVVPPVRTPVVGSPTEAETNPLPLSSAAGQADTSRQLAAGGFAGLAALLALGAGFVLRRRHGDV